ncbi:MAG TPA: deoxyribodipyrimidine photo-lyase [Bacteroidia bacterium]|nr:deoxyribodipyrimidine photo-lyase [Bacteroidia bacterium]HRG52818.1 deoxyribodipyrimidine photo-lyase [Bacteroidia bacterium]
MNKEKPISIFWFRRDLRLEDNAGLYHALKEQENVLPIFIFDTDILNRLENKEDRRVEFIYENLKELKEKLEKQGTSLLVLHDTAPQAFESLIKKYNLNAVYTNHDYEPAAIKRDESIHKLLAKHHIEFKTFKDQVIFEKNEVTKDDGLPYTVFTPYMRKWKNALNDFYLKSYPTKKYFPRFLPVEAFLFPTLKEIGFRPTGYCYAKPTVDKSKISVYDKQRDYPAIHGTTRLSVHLRFGTVSIRQLVNIARELNETWLNELIWREFYMQILFHFPHVEKSSFKKQYDEIKWRNNEKEFQAWCEGKTGYPIVDAGMRELNTTGFMHNRVRMITASFLIKHLLIDWRWGEAYFAEKLFDFDLAANNGGWQWAASSGCDAAPYFRIFNPTEQTKRFDPDQKYIKKWVPELEELSYPAPIVEHKFARERVLLVYKKALDKK